MPLDATITNGVVTYRLKLTKATIMINRQPMQTGLPATDPILIDLGQLLPQLVLEGKVDEATPPQDEGVAVPNKRQLEDFVEGNPADGALEVVISDDTYVARVKMLRLEMEAAREAVWSFSLHFVAQRRQEP